MHEVTATSNPSLLKFLSPGLWFYIVGGKYCKIGKFQSSKLFVGCFIVAFLNVILLTHISLVQGCNDSVSLK